tara:strand:+ start:740 stop:886 length:147 start_codon:yes stop_codon:yes gene_type:complete
VVDILFGRKDILAGSNPAPSAKRRIDDSIYFIFINNSYIGYFYNFMVR